MGLRGIENSVTRLDDVFVPDGERDRRARATGLKIALTTLNTGRLALPAICVGVGKWATKIAREWSAERVQWGRPVGKHDAVAQKIAFIAATAFGLEAMLDVASRLADDKRNDIRIEAAIAKLYGSEMGWKIVDELMQIRGGRGYETAESLKARGEKPVPVEQMLRDMRINRIFEGSTRDHAPADRPRGGRPAPRGRRRHARRGDGDAQGRRRDAAMQAGRSTRKWLPQLAVGEGQKPRLLRRVRRRSPTHLRYVERASRKLARSTFYAMAPLAGQARDRSRRSSGRIVDIGAELFAISAAVVYADTIGREQPERSERGARARRPVLRAGAPPRRHAVPRAVGQRRRRQLQRARRRCSTGRYAWLEEGVVDPSGDGPMMPALD